MSKEPLPDEVEHYHSHTTNESLKSVYICACGNRYGRYEALEGHIRWQELKLAAPPKLCACHANHLPSKASAS